MTLRERLGLVKGADLMISPAYSAWATGRRKSLTDMTSTEFLDRYLPSYSKGKSFSWSLMKWRSHTGSMKVTEVKDGNYTSYKVVMSFKTKQEALEWRNKYIIDNGLLGEFKLI